MSKPTSITISMSELYVFMTCTIRYALRSTTYVVEDACKAIESHIESFDRSQIGVFIRDIEEFLKDNSLGCIETSSMWARTLDRLKKVFEKQGKKT